MHALVFDRFGGPEVLHWAEVPDPAPGPEQALVRLKSVGLNLADVYRRKGNYHLAGSPPWILGYEGAGVLEHPAGEWPAGTRVAFADSPHANAELAAVDVDRLVLLPDAIDFDTAAAVLLQGLTAQYLVKDSFAVRPGHLAVVHAAAGGVGQLLVQMLKSAGATVLGIASSEDKRAAAKAAGADAAVDYGELVAKARELSGGKGGADVVYDSVGRTLPRSLEAARTGGAVVFYGMAAGDPDPVDPRLLMDRSLTLTGGDLWNVLTSAEVRRERAAELFGRVEHGSLVVRIAGRFPLKDGAEAHRFLESRQAVGKVLLTR